MHPEPEASKSMEESLDAGRYVDSKSNTRESSELQPSLANAEARNT